MRRLTVLAAFAALSATLAFTQPAAAAPVTVAPVTIAPALQAEFAETYGVREAAYLQEEVTRQVAQALQRVDGAAPVTVEVSIVDARPTRPTIQQLSARPGLDAIRSVSIGGAELTAVLRGANGQVIGEVAHRRYSPDITDAAYSAGPWSDARLTIRQFARKCADAYLEQAPR